jgi:hypothetical protein
MRFLLPLVIAGSLGAAACEPTVQATAPNVANPVLLGPVDRVGGHRTEAGPPTGHFVTVLEDGVSSSAGAFGGTVSTHTIGYDARNVTYAVLGATLADPALDAHIDQVMSEGSCMFAVFAGECHETAVLQGHVAAHDPHRPARPAPPPVEGATP